MNWIEERKRQLAEERAQAKYDESLLEKRASYDSEAEAQKAINDIKADIKKYNDHKNKANARLEQKIKQYEEMIKDAQKEYQSIAAEDNREINVLEEKLFDIMSLAKKNNWKVRSEESTDVEYRANDKAQYQKKYDNAMEQAKEMYNLANKRLKEGNEEYAKAQKAYNSYLKEMNEWKKVALKTRREAEQNGFELKDYGFEGM